MIGRAVASRYDLSHGRQACPWWVVCLAIAQQSSRSCWGRMAGTTGGCVSLPSSNSPASWHRSTAAAARSPCCSILCPATRCHSYSCTPSWMLSGENNSNLVLYMYDGDQCLPTLVWPAWNWRSWACGWRWVCCGESVCDAVSYYCTGNCTPTALPWTVSPLLPSLAPCPSCTLPGCTHSMVSPCMRSHPLIYTHATPLYSCALGSSLFIYSVSGTSSLPWLASSALSSLLPNPRTYTYSYSYPPPYSHLFHSFPSCPSLVFWSLLLWFCSFLLIFANILLLFVIFSKHSHFILL